jgi:8-oxo-dGTP pyrophosphatase MutT (NUDIX family)
MKVNVWVWIIIQNWRILLIKRSKDLPNPNFWAFPWGRQDGENETPEETTIREVKEETWLEFKIEKLYDYDETEKAYYYDFLGKWSGKIILQVEECDWYGWFTYEETKYLPIQEKMKTTIKKLYEEGLIG